MVTFFGVVFGFYFLLLLTLLIGWVMGARTNVALSTKKQFISVLVAMRNEEANIKNLLLSLSDQSYPPKDFEIILVDDHSTDNSVEEAKKWLDRLGSLRIVSLDDERQGKKAALVFGIGFSKGGIIATTDADCIVPSHWLQDINDCFQKEEVNLLIGKVALQNENSFFSKLQSIEFASVIGTSISSAQLGKAIMCNGANLSFRKKIFDEVNGYAGNEHIASGDDEFLMRKIDKKYPNSIHVLPGSVVITNAQQTSGDFIRQRFRWASKWKVNSSWLARLFAVFILLLQVAWLTLVVWAIGHWSIAAASILFVKLMGDFVFLSRVCRSLKMKFHPIAFMALQFLYPVYVLCVGIISQMKNHQWKGRTY